MKISAMFLIGLVICGCTHDDRAHFDTVGVLRDEKVTLFCFDQGTIERCVRAAGLNGYDVHNLAENKTAVRMRGTVITVSPQSPDCELSQIGCKKFKQLSVDSLEILD